MLITIQRNGKVLKVQREQQGQPNPALPQGLQPNMGDTMSQFFVPFPDKDLKPGDTWSFKGDMPAPFGGKMTLKTKSTFLGVETVDGVKCAKIKTEFSLPLTLSMANAPNQPGAGTMKGAVKGTTITYFELSTGQVYQSETEAKSTMSMSGPANPNDPSGQSITVKSASNIRSKMKRLKE
jgi:hypothetical protein